jgi:putative redox protein
MDTHVKLAWKGEGLLFVGASERGRVDLASSLDDEGRGPTPTETLLIALGGCTGMDVVSILTKMRQAPTGFWIEVTGTRRKERPRPFAAIAIVYHLEGDLDDAKVRRAIELSERKYCPVGAMLRPAVSITSSYVIHRPADTATS